MAPRKTQDLNLDWALSSLPIHEVRNHAVYGNQLRQRIVDGYQGDITVTAAQLAETYQGTPAWICSVLKEAGVEVRPTGRRRKERPYSDQQLRYVYEVEKYSIRDLAKQHSCTRDAVRRDLKRLGVKIRSRSEQRKMKR